MFETWCSGMGLGGWVVMIGLWVGVIAAAVWGITRLFPTGQPQPTPDGWTGTPREILDQRLASGQIDSQTYQQLLRELTLKRP